MRGVPNLLIVKAERVIQNEKLSDKWEAMHGIGQLGNDHVTHVPLAEPSLGTKLWSTGHPTPENAGCPCLLVFIVQF